MLRMVMLVVSWMPPSKANAIAVPRHVALIVLSAMSSLPTLRNAALIP